MKETFVAVRSDSVMPSTGCLLFHLFEEISINAYRKPLKWLLVLEFLTPCLLPIKTHLSKEQASSYTLETLSVFFQSFIFTLIELHPCWRGGQGLIRLRMAHKVALSSSGHWSEQTVPCHFQLFRDIRKTFWNTSCLAVFSAQSPKTTSVAV